MQALIDYFSAIPALHRGLILGGGIAVFWLVENVVPERRFDYRRWHHAGLNIFFTLTTIAVNFVLAFLLLMAAEWCTRNRFGLLHWLDLGPWLSLLTGLLLLDLIGAYLAHVVQHRTKWMWRFHLIHHTDTCIDTTSANRHHPGESVIRFFFTVLAVLITGAPMWLVFLYQSLSVAFSQFIHANISLPSAIDRIIGYVFVTPAQHRVHHHYVLPFTDSNYGNIFSLWDRWFGTLRHLPSSEIVFGIDTHMMPEENNRLSSLLKIPFNKVPTATANAEKKFPGA